ncbi:MAG: Lrp/AsnC family transcriptional regulator [Nitrososphaeria archaeon]|nr:Lrp/AsnC family transcriptional regulator [Nitrososphaeria archaeon]NDB51760.1 Lrp/AsnC family transcriptional regulator [Nitrosopumilaceae archaeon]NDB88955.1 Lrp/AsnC family transcriptional regulator [Nitrososphaerota archaeon]NDB46878.1 Lrp/AsnC family transcriptional regulator [Nitrososphaeria archaeon]NDB90936.1 Lrp/AsnC family transcriptional regulator [Nitrososphaerota archaeon]
MTTAYVLINCEHGAEEAIYSQLKLISKIQETRSVFGAYDIVTKIEASSVSLIKDIIATKILGIDKIRSILTLMGSEKEK